VTLQSCS